MHPGSNAAQSVTYPGSSAAHIQALADVVEMSASRSMA